MKIVRAIRQGRIVPNKPSVNKPQFYALWSSADQQPAEHAMHMPAPQQRLPTDAESYNPPAEYLLDDDERAVWEETEKGDRKREFMPAKYESLRKVPAYHEFVQERFERCLDLYLAPRMRKTRLNIDPESLIPKLPSPKELRPFPTTTSLRYAHPGQPRVRCISVDPTGNWVATGSEDGTVRVWELANARLAWRCEVGKGPVAAVEWCPDKTVGLLGVAVSVPSFSCLNACLDSPLTPQLACVFPFNSENRISIVCPTPILPVELAHNSALVALKAVTGASTNAAPRGDDVAWLRGTDQERKRGILVNVDVPGTPKQVTWHKKGDYFATVAADGTSPLSPSSFLLITLSDLSPQPPTSRFSSTSCRSTRRSRRSRRPRDPSRRSPSTLPNLTSLSSRSDTSDCTTLLARRSSRRSSRVSSGCRRSTSTRSETTSSLEVTTRSSAGSTST